jgi:hypothetical protein
MSNIPVEEEFEEILLNIELRVTMMFRENPTMTDYVAAEVYEALALHYSAMVTGRTPPKPRVKGLALDLFDDIQKVCNLCLEDGASDKLVKKKNSPIQTISKEDLVRCLRRLQKSVKLWTEKGGRQGYLKFVSTFI